MRSIAMLNMVVPDMSDSHRSPQHVRCSRILEHLDDKDNTTGWCAVLMRREVSAAGRHVPEGPLRLALRPSFLSCPSAAINAPQAQDIFDCPGLAMAPTSPAELMAMCGKEKNT